MSTGYANPYVVAEAAPSERAEFIKKTYLHLAGAIAAFIAVEALLLQIPGIEVMIAKMGGTWLLVLGAFMLVSYIADKWALSDASRGMQYAGLGLFVVVQAILFLPLIYIALNFVPEGSQLIAQAGLITGLMVAGITATALITKKDFSFLKGILTVGGFVAMGMIVASHLFDFDTGIYFAGGMVVFASVSILYTTSNILHRYGTHQFVAASLALFAGVALLFIYVLQILMSLANND